MNSPFSDRLDAYRLRLQQTAERMLPPAQHYPARLHEAMRYAADGGKRLRPLLVYGAGETLGLTTRRLDAAACAVELIHVYSLVHDDLPAMDDDDLRRGRATTHKAYDEATAILVGDGLQALAFQVLASDHDSGLDAGQRLQMVELLAEAAGSRGMVGGQAVDLAAEGQTLNLAELEALHIHKTGAMIRVCLQLACTAALDLPPAQREALDHYGKCVGLAFQIQDDVLDVESSSAILGKTAGKDSVHLKSTYPSVMGLPAAKLRARELFDSACQGLAVFNDAAEPLRWLARHIEARQN